MLPESTPRSFAAIRGATETASPASMNPPRAGLKSEMMRSQLVPMARPSRISNDSVSATHWAPTMNCRRRLRASSQRAVSQATANTMHAADEHADLPGAQIAEAGAMNSSRTMPCAVSARMMSIHASSARCHGAVST